MTDRTPRVTADTLPSAGAGRCLSEDEVLGFAEGGLLDAGQRARIDQHIDVCPVCLELVSSVARELPWVQGEGLSQGLGPHASGSQIVSAFAPGTLVSGRYRVARFVARGGMGEVYEARDLKLSERVALKTVVCTAEDSPHAVRKLLDEVQLARRIQHRNVCRIHELHEHTPHGGGAPVQFLSMEFIEGERLGDYVRGRGRLPVDEAVAIARQLLAGLQAAHAARVLHLDFKTDNVMLRRGSGAPDAVIMDFGLSRAFETEARARTSEQRQLAGSLAYMSPEQIECRERLGPEADIYAFGIVFFEMLTGRLPFEGASPVAVMMKRLKERPPAPSRIVPDIPPGLDTFLLRCLSRARRARYHDIGSVSEALEAAVRGGRPRQRRRVLVAGGALAALGVCVAYGLAFPTGPGFSAARAVTESAPLSPRPLPPAPAGLAAKPLPVTEPASPAPPRPQAAPAAAEVAEVAVEAKGVRPRGPSSARASRHPPSPLGAAKNAPEALAAPASARGKAPPNGGELALPSPEAPQKAAVRPGGTSGSASSGPASSGPASSGPALPGAPSGLSW